ncbi:MAG: hypothetical protein KC425_20920, partial [Anaerolineales bacterium]|nr:hypothetical protein [Anaerolineales bacterium]
AAAVWLWRQRGAAILPRLARWRRPVLGALAAALLLLTAYAWFIRPALPAPPAWQDTYSGGLIPFTDNENLPRFGWYLSPLGVWLGALGIAWLVWRANAKTAVLLAVALFYTIFYLASIRANPHQVYAARRYVMAALPLFTLGTGVLLTTLYRTGVQEKTFRNAEIRKEPQRDAKNLEISLRLFASSLRSLRSLTYAIRNPQSAIRLLTLLLTLAWLASTAWAARGFVSQVDYRGVIAQLDAVNAQLEPRSVLLFADPNPIGQGDFWGTPLKFLYGHAVFTLRDPAAAEAPLLVQTIESWQNNGRTVYWIGSPAWLDAAGLPYQPRLTATLASAALEGVYDHKPQAVLPVRWQLAIVEIDDVNNASGANESR